MVGSQDTAILMENLCVLHHKEGGSVTVAVGFSDRQHMTHDTLQMTSDTRLYNKNTNHKYIYIYQTRCSRNCSTITFVTY